ncbi:MAG: imidazole glycerol phosphate synthase subunit HisH [Candidatus Altiarchaeota archaeon]
MIVCIDYGAGNLRSIVNGFRKVGAKVELTEDPGRLKTADAIVLPGVGSFGDAMEKLITFKPAILEAVEAGTPFIGMCLGEQVIFESSDESPAVEGLGLFEGTCKRFHAKGLKVPHMGWNTITKVGDCPILEGTKDGEYFYFVHSYHVVPKERGVIAAETGYGTAFPSVVADRNVFATQFHPEKSGPQGLRILENFVKQAKR